MSVKKIQFDGNTLIDLTQDTVVSSKLHSGYTAHDANGDIITGSYAPPSGSMNITANGTYDVTDKASAVVAIPAFSVTNLVPSSKESDGTPYNGGTGYKTGYRLSTSVGSPSEEKAHSSYAITGFIPVVRNDVIRVMKCGFSPAAYAIGIWIFDSNQNLLNALQFTSQTAAASYRLQDQMWNILLNGSNSTTSDSVAYVRIVFNANMAGNLIVTKNEKISPLEV